MLCDFDCALRICFDLYIKSFDVVNHEKKSVCLHFESNVAAPGRHYDKVCFSKNSAFELCACTLFSFFYQFFHFESTRFVRMKSCALGIVYSDTFFATLKSRPFVGMEAYILTSPMIQCLFSILLKTKCGFCSILFCDIL